MTDTALARLATRMGIIEDFHQVDGSHHVAGPDTQRALLAAMGVPAPTEAEAAERLAALEAADAGRRIPPAILLSAGVAVERALPPWCLRLETGETLTADPHRPDRLPPLPMGVHVLEAGADRALVIASPAVAPGIAGLTGRSRIWGIIGSLYGLRSARNAGVGDFEDLACAAEALSDSGADFFGINPAHARGVADDGTSPYSPSSRTAFDTGHIALDRVPEIARCPQAEAHLAAAGAALARAREADLVDYGVRRDLAEPVLRALFGRFLADGSTPRRAAFDSWRRARPEPVAAQSVFEALSLLNGPDWRSWPPSLRAPDSPAVRAFAAECAEDILYQDWRQWIATEQIAEAHHRARGAGMQLGLYLDVAVGVRPGAAETWANPGVFASACSLGAPPDLLNSEGQRWDLAPFSPTGLAGADYAPFRAMLQAAMAHAGMVRIDHVIGFHRSFWVPDGGAPGGYVRFPGDVLMALTRIEATRAACVVVGEDLGTVPEGLRDALGASGLLGCSILPFEREGDGIGAPEHYRPLTLASFGTHDLPTIAGWWQGRDIEIRTDLGHLTGDPVRWSHDDRAWLRTRICHLLRDRGLLPEGIDADAPPERMQDDLLDAIHALLGLAGSEAVAIQLDDLFGETEPQNVPGTVAEQPNWRRRCRLPVEALADAPELGRAATAMQRAGRGGRRHRPHLAMGAEQ